MTALLHAWRQLAAISGSEAMAAELPATEAEIAEAEKKLKRALPPAVTAMLRLSRAWGWYRKALDTVIVLSPDEIVAQTLKPSDESLVLEIEDAATPRVEAKVYGPGRTTFARTGYLFFQVDDDPPPGGRPGQVVAIEFEEGVVDVVFESVDEFIARGLRSLQVQAGSEAIAIADIDAASLPPLVALPERKPLKQPTTCDATCATLLDIDAWLHAALPPDMQRLKAGATVKKIRQFLSAEGHSLPEALSRCSRRSMASPRGACRCCCAHFGGARAWCFTTSKTARAVATTPGALPITRNPGATAPCNHPG